MVTERRQGDRDNMPRLHRMRRCQRRTARSYTARFDQPWTKLHIVFLGPIEGHTFLAPVDACSKWIEAVRMKTTGANAVISMFRGMWARYGLPKQVVSDNGPPFSSAEFETFLRRNSVKHILSAPYYQASNGAEENGVNICKKAIKKSE